MTRSKLARVCFGVALFVGAGMGVGRQEVRAQTEVVEGVYLWKDTSGKCPAACDNNQYDCPCKTG